MGPGFPVYRVPVKDLAPSEDITGMPDKMADVARYAGMLKQGSEPPALFGHPGADGKVAITSGSRRLLAARQAGIEALPARRRSGIA